MLHYRRLSLLMEAHHLGLRKILQDLVLSGFIPLLAFLHIPVSDLEHPRPNNTHAIHLVVPLLLNRP